MKNLFRINRTNNDLSNLYDTTPFDEDRISDGLERELAAVTEGALGAEEPDIKAASRPDWRFWVGIGLLVSVVTIVLAAKDTVLSAENRWMTWALLGVLLIATVFISLSRRSQRKSIESTMKSQTQYDFKESMEKMQELSEKARAELHIPEDALEADIFPFVYKMKGTAQKNCYGKGKFDNLPMLMWRRGDRLCLSDSHVVTAIPTDAILGKQLYQEEFHIDMWLKEVDCNKGRFKPYNLRKSGLMGCRGHAYYGITVRTQSGDSFEILIPEYDLCELEKLVDIPTLADPTV